MFIQGEPKPGPVSTDLVPLLPGCHLGSGQLQGAPVSLELAGV